jgi:two-component system cell cycle sensor histidine kinase/response regulator CckA
MIDLIITDLAMPVMDGFALVQAIQGDRPHAKIICISGYVNQACPQSATLLPKPIVPSQLLETVNRICAHQST